MPNSRTRSTKKKHKARVRARKKKIDQKRQAFMNHRKREIKKEIKLRELAGEGVMDLTTQNLEEMQEKYALENALENPNVILDNDINEEE